MRLLLNTSLFPNTFYCTNWKCLFDYRSICKRIVELYMTAILINFKKSVPLQYFHNFSHFFVTILPFIHHTQNYANVQFFVLIYWLCRIIQKAFFRNKFVAEFLQNIRILA